MLNPLIRQSGSQYPRSGVQALSEGRQRICLILITIYLIGFHLRLSIYSASGTTIVPMYPMLLSGALLLLLYGNQLVKSAGQRLILLVLFIALQPTLALAPGSGGSGSLFSAIQLVASLVAAIAIVLTCSQIRASRLRRLFLGFWFVLMALALLESIGLRPIFDDLRAALYSGSQRGVYSELNRDIGLYGKSRPSALASEPSYLADSYMCMIALVFLLDKERGSKRSWIRLALMVCISFTIAPSFKVFFYLLALVVWQMWPRSVRALHFLVAALAVAALSLYAIFGSVTGALSSQLGVGETGSFFGRISVAPQVAVDALSRFPILGYGVGNTDGLYPVIVEAWQSSGAFARFPWYIGLDSTLLMTNGFWWQWVFLGTLGGALFSVIILRILGSLGVDRPLRSLVCAWIVWYSGFAFVDPASWWIVALFSVAALARTMNEPGSSDMQHRASRSAVRP